MAIREGRWDCPACGSTGLFGRDLSCAGCGKPRPEGIRFYLTEDAPVVVDPARLAEASAGPDWVCEHCGGSNRAGDAVCSGCGASRGGSPVQAVADLSLAETPRSGAEPAATPDATAPAPPKQPGGCCGCGCLGLLLVAIVLSLLSWCAGPPLGGEELIPATVAAKSWVRAVEVEAREVVAAEGWELPDSAQRVRRERRVSGYDQVVEGYRTVTRRVPRTERVPDGTETRSHEVSERVQTGTREYVCGNRDLGNGYFEDITCEEPVYETRSHTETEEVPRYRTETYYDEVTEREPITRSVPRYGTWYRYRVPRWSVVRTPRSAGGEEEPVWPELALGRHEREGQRTEHYTVVLRSARGAQVLSPGELEWRRYRVGQRLALRPRRDYRNGRDSSWVEVLPPDSLTECRRWHRDRERPPPDSLGCSPPPAAPAAVGILQIRAASVI